MIIAVEDPPRNFFPASGSILPAIHDTPESSFRRNKRAVMVTLANRTGNEDTVYQWTRNCFFVMHRTYPPATGELRGRVIRVFTTLGQALIGPPCRIKMNLINSSLLISTACAQLRQRGRSERAHTIPLQLNRWNLGAPIGPNWAADLKAPPPHLRQRMCAPAWRTFFASKNAAAG